MTKHPLKSFLFAGMIPIAGVLNAQDETIVHDDGSVGIVVSQPGGGSEYIHLDTPQQKQPQPRQNQRPQGRQGPPPPMEDGGPRGPGPQADGAAAQGRQVNGGVARPSVAPARAAAMGRQGPSVGMQQPDGMPQNKNLERVNPNESLQGPFYFIDETPAQVIQTLEALLGKGILQAQALPQVKLNFISKKQMSREDAVNALKSLLALNGIAITPMDDKFYRALPIIGVGRQSPEFIAGDASKLPASQVFYTKLFELEYIDVAAVQSKIKNLMSVDGTGLIETFPRSNAILVTDTLINIQNIEALLKKLDAPVQIGEEIAFIALKNVSANEIREKLNSIQGDLLRKYFEKTTIETDTRTNQLIIVTQKGNLEFIKKIIAGLDIEAEPVLKNEVILVRHCEASEIETVLKSIITQQQQQVSQNARDRRDAASAAARDAALRANAARNAGNQNASVVTSGVSSSSDSGMTGVEFSEYVQVVSHASSSSIVVYGTDSDIKQLKSIVKRLDVAIDQVRIDVIITEVNLTDSQVSGLSSFGISYNVPNETFNPNANNFSLNTGSNSLDDSGSQAFQFGISEDAFIASFNLARQSQNVKVLSAPVIVTTHAKEAQINVLEEYPTVSSSVTDISNSSTSNRSYSYKEIGIKLIVKPFIGTDGVIRMEIDQSVDSIARYTDIDDNRQPVVNQRRAQSVVSVKDNQVVVLGGLQQTDVSDSEGSVWLLGDIPIIGSMFRPEQASTKRRELIMFIRPRIIRSSSVDELLTGQTLNDSFVEREVKNFLNNGQFYSEGEVQTKIREFEDNRLYNKIFADPEAFIKMDNVVLNNSLADNDKKMKAAKKVAEEAPLAKDVDKRNASAARNISESTEKADESVTEADKERGNKALRMRRRK